MRILLDTNIFIYREYDQIVSKDLQLALASLNKLRAETLIHPLSKKEVENDPQPDRRKKMLSKLGSYPILESPPNFSGDQQYISVMRTSRINGDVIDCELLYTVYKNAVDYLITEDRDIHRDAAYAGVERRVLLISEARDLFRQMLSKETLISPPSIQYVPLHNLSLKDPIFDDLKAEYGNFEKWFIEKCREGRNGWVYRREDGAIGAMLIYKIEDEPIPSEPPLHRERRVKICTLIVKLVGFKMGELFIKLAVTYAVKNGIDVIYLTHFIKPKDELVNLIIDYGFQHVANQNRDDKSEAIYLKRLTPEASKALNLTPNEISSRYYPSFCDGARVDKFIVPIRPEYHDRLFTDSPHRQTTIYEHDGQIIIEGNTIKKAYLCHPLTRKVKKGDLLLFYRSGDVKGLTTLGVVDSIDYGISDQEEVQRLVGKRTVYTRNEISDMLESPLTVILFRHHFHFTKPVQYGELLDLGVLRGPPQSIKQITHEEYLMVKKRSGIDGRFAFN